MTPRTPPVPIPFGKQAPPAERDWIDTAVEWTSGLAAVAMFAYGVALSYAVLYAIAQAAGLPPWARWLWPAGWELFMASAALNALAEQRHLRGQHGLGRVPWYPLALTGLTAGGSILLNWFHPAIPLDPPPGWLVSLVYGLPPLEAVLAWHLFLLRIAHRRQQAHRPAGTVPVAVPQRSVPGDSPDGGATTGGTGPGDPALGLMVDGHRGPSSPDRSPTAPARSRPAPVQSAAGAAGAVDAGLLAGARAAAAEHEHAHGRPISRDALRQALRVSNRTAGALLHQLRADQADPDRQSGDQDRDGGVPVPAEQPRTATPSQGFEGGVAAGNGAGGRPAGLAALVPVPIPGPVPEPAGEARGWPGTHDRSCRYQHRPAGTGGGVLVLVAVLALLVLAAPQAHTLRPVFDRLRQAGPLPSVAVPAPLRGGGGGGGGGVCPVRGPVRIGQGWGAPRDGGRRRHQGIDLLAPAGTPLVAVADGRITRTSNLERGRGGISLWLRDRRGTGYYYAHNQRNLARVGQRVRARQVIALLGATGNARGGPPHLHFQLHPGGGPPVNPDATVRRWC